MGIILRLSPNTLIPKWLIKKPNKSSASAERRTPPLLPTPARVPASSRLTESHSTSSNQHPCASRFTSPSFSSVPTASRTSTSASVYVVVVPPPRSWLSVLLLPSQSSLTTKSTTMTPASVSLRNSLSNTTRDSSSLIPAVRNPRSSEVTVPAHVPRSLIVDHD